MVAEMEERRQSLRQRVFKAGTIEFNRAGGISCLVRNVSANGACVEVESVVGVPAAFKLLVIGEKAPHPCRVIWRFATRMGVAFDQAAD
jgi:hypothetical protein